MHIIIAGEGLEAYLFEFIKISKIFSYNVIFIKHFSKKLDKHDIIIVESSLVNEIPLDSENLIITVVKQLNYKKRLKNEEVVSISSLGKIEEIIKKYQCVKNEIIFYDPLSIKIFSIARRIANTDANILITGRTGTGKEVLAKYIHQNSYRRNNKFVSLNCAALPETLLESELFGHERGAFTNALYKRVGKFEEAQNGTILLDEISETSLVFQAKLLRVIQEKEITRLGSNQNIKIDVRIIATSNKDLEQEVNNGCFREDLFYRLNVFPIFLPTLNDRAGDIEFLSNYFCDKYSNFSKKLSASVIEKLINREWKGNIRELENFIHRIVLLSDEKIINTFEELEEVPKMSKNNYKYF